MNIALIAHNSKKELMIQFCTAYCNIFKKHTLLATATTGRLISEATGLRIHCFLPGSHGGMEQIMARIACDEVDLLLFFRDPLRAGPDEPSSINILRLCDVHTVPVATNIATAEALVHGLERGDLAWREYLHE
ncbi:MAG: methylglyoxal synthase [Subdoligranulum sp.]|nr:methylglyoxal synthase [Subdoligranulum sp.]MCI7543152.1 methylglyoxal synthase [Subdoligranulum sp.]MDD7265697.1 methylglyoxal synthase [Subdoligranulum sp.]MDY5922526.1 methylglyoxal synthase [Oscillospiraceae bacterium]